ncbi:MAG: DUF167 domain-containing protein [Alphaproteobacteria bacterium]
MKVKVWLSPRAKANRIGGVASDADGNPVLRVSVVAAPERGKANQALVALLAAEWDLPKTAFEIAAGLTDRRKSIVIAGDAPLLMRRLMEWTEKHHG